ncbi:MAG TPA: hypothetical protein VG406_27125 [Isosphaeraceae bacterium]|jgi:hypothetical protein|nr:hypothetical protein [Isosphaeraceae bacterium]
MARWALAAALAAWIGGQFSGGMAFAQNQGQAKAKAPAKPATTAPADDPDADDEETPKAQPKPRVADTAPSPDAKAKVAAAKKADPKAKTKATTAGKSATTTAKNATKAKTPAKKADPKAKKAPSRQMEQARKTVEKRRAATKARAEAEHRRQAEERDQQIKLLELELKLAQERGAEQAELARIQADIVRQQTMLQLAQLELAKINALFNPGAAAAPTADGSQFAVAGALQVATNQDAFGAVNTTAKVQAGDGTIYTLDFTGRDDLRAQALRLNEREVLVAGTLRVVRAAGAPSSKVLVVASVGDLAQEQRRLAGMGGLGQGFGQGAVGSPVPGVPSQVPVPGVGGVGEFPVNPGFP